MADFAPVTLMVSFPIFMVVPNSSPLARRRFVAYAKEKGGKLTYATPGVGTSPHMSGELFKRMAKVEITHVPYRGRRAGL